MNPRDGLKFDVKTRCSDIASVWSTASYNCSEDDHYRCKDQMHSCNEKITHRCGR